MTAFSIVLEDLSLSSEGARILRCTAMPHGGAPTTGIDYNSWREYCTEYVVEMFQDRSVTLIGPYSPGAFIYNNFDSPIVFADAFGYKAAAVAWHSCPKAILVCACKHYEFELSTLCIASPAINDIARLERIDRVSSEWLDDGISSCKEEVILCTNDGNELIYMNSHSGIEHIVRRAKEIAKKHNATIGWAGS